MRILSSNSQMAVDHMEKPTPHGIRATEDCRGILCLDTHISCHNYIVVVDQLLSYHKNVKLKWGGEGGGREASLKSRRARSFFYSNMYTYIHTSMHMYVILGLHTE